MRGPDDVQAVLFDFFGTLVRYVPDRSELTYPATHQLAKTFGYRFDHERFIGDWHAASIELEATCAVDNVEFSMTDAARAFASRVEMRINEEAAARLGRSFVSNWQRHVRAGDGMIELVHALSGEYRLGIVSNTHDPHMVPSMLMSFGILDCFDVVVLSVVHGHRKPHPSIYNVALDSLGLEPAAVMFVGDSFDADFDAPSALGMRAVLIADHDQRVPNSARLDSVVQLPRRLSSHRM